MSRRYLFSPIGGTDPISSTNMYDGSLLHICRHYRPDVVYLYLSGEILENERQDNRYMYCLERLDEQQERKTEYVRIERPALSNVQEFDFFYQDFRTIIEKIQSDMEPGDELLLNVSSGTPAMKSGLLVLKTLGEFPCTAIQVLTPERKMNNHDHRSYDVETLWELNGSLEESGENRCREVSCPTLSLIKQENAIKELVRKYDYAGALTIAELLPEKETEGYRNLLKMAERRTLLDAPRVEEVLRKDARYVLPVRDGSERKYYEYVLGVQLRLKKGEYADFVRALTPILTVIFIKIISAQTEIKLERYCRESEGGLRWKLRELQGTDFEQAVGLKVYYDGAYVKNVELYKIIDLYCSNPHTRKVTEVLRGVEENIRNMAAHEIMCINEERIKKTTGYSGEQIMDYIRQGLLCAGFHFAEKWDVYQGSYDEMNRVIIAAIEHTRE